ncbi:hypothetical protein HanRHA438_Chr06g0280431 [Helianthus annuus]|nr:hypothetical protein HanRHA438_Chr06g0280431 [Helianthus annuus]
MTVMYGSRNSNCTDKDLWFVATRVTMRQSNLRGTERTKNQSASPLTAPPKPSKLCVLQ